MSPLVVRDSMRPGRRRVYLASPSSTVVHDGHRGVNPVHWFTSLAEAEAQGCRACRVCKPS